MVYAPCGSLLACRTEQQQQLQPLNAARPSPFPLPTDFAAQHGIVCDTEKIGIDFVNTAMERLVKNDVHYRCVLIVYGLNGIGLGCSLNWFFALEVRPLRWRCIIPTQLATLVLQVRD